MKEKEIRFSKPKVVSKFGNAGHICIPKEYLGMEVIGITVRVFNGEVSSKRSINPNPVGESDEEAIRYPNQALTKYPSVKYLKSRYGELSKEEIDEIHTEIDNQISINYTFSLPWLDNYVQTYLGKE